MGYMLFNILIVMISFSAFSKQAEEIISPDLIQAYNIVKKEKAENLSVDPVVSSAETFRGKSAAQATHLLADRYSKHWWQRSELKDTNLGQKVELIEKGLKQQISYKKGEVNHKIDFSVESFSALAKIEYTGFFKASVLYQARDASSVVEVANKIGQQKDLILSSSKNALEQKSAVNLQWNW